MQETILEIKLIGYSDRGEGERKQERQEIHLSLDVTVCSLYAVDGHFYIGNDTHILALFGNNFTILLIRTIISPIIPV